MIGLGIRSIAAPGVCGAALTAATAFAADGDASGAPIGLLLFGAAILLLAILAAAFGRKARRGGGGRGSSDGFVYPGAEGGQSVKKGPTDSDGGGDGGGD